MEYNSDFSHDLKIGQLGEKLLGAVLDHKKIEVKTDFQALKTGNVFIEYQSRGKKSGIATTQAEWYCFILSNVQIILISTDNLKAISREFLNTDRDIRGGDSNTSRGLLVPIDKLLKKTENET